MNNNECPILLISDIHGNLEALKAVMKHAEGLYQEIWVLGDIVGYGPDPAACIDLLLKRNAHIICGNHDQAVCGKIDVDGLNEEAKSAVLIHREILSDSHKTFLENLPEVLVRRSVTMVHGSLLNPIWGYILNSTDASLTLNQTQTSLTVVGHSHIPGIWAYNSDRGSVPVQMKCNVEFDYSGVPHLANPGSVGQSRDGVKKARYMLLTPERKKLCFRQCSWNSRPLRKKMIAGGYLPSLIERMTR